jgi:hypothetical protein
MSSPEEYSSLSGVHSNVHLRPTAPLLSGRADERTPQGLGRWEEAVGELEQCINSGLGGQDRAVHKALQVRTPSRRSHRSCALISRIQSCVPRAGARSAPRGQLSGRGPPLQHAQFLVKKSQRKCLYELLSAPPPAPPRHDHHAVCGVGFFLSILTGRARISQAWKIRRRRRRSKFAPRTPARPPRDNAPA